MTFLAVAVAGAIGAVSRFGLDRVVQGNTEAAFPWGTFTINITGSFVLGVITGAALYHGFDGIPRIVLGTGFCGAYTTFSGWVLDSVELLEERRPGVALANVVGSVLTGSAAAALGLLVAAR